MADQTSAIETVEELRTFKLSPAEYEATIAKAAKLNAAKAKKGFTGKITVNGERKETTHTNIYGIKVTEVYYEVSIDGEPAHYDGWKFLATAEWDKNAGLIVKTAPGVDKVNRDSLVENGCAHCGITRYRKATYILADDNGNEIQVGSACLKDFLPSGFYPTWFIDSETAEDELIGGYSYGGDPSYSVDTVLGIAWAAIQKFKYVRSGDWEGIPTKGIVLDVLNPPSRMNPEQKARIQEVATLANDMGDKAKLVREFILSDEFSGNSEYVLNLKSLMTADYVSSRNIGYVVSAPQAWAKHMEKTLIAEKAKANPSVHMGTIGQKKFSVKVTLTKIVYLGEDNYGNTVSVYRMITDDGNIVSWKTGKDIEKNEGDSFTITGTIKDHSTRYGVETVLSYCKIS